jgi:vancomycin aglycone glucosyltransferase
MRAVIAALGSRGDVQPCLALALALRRAGHQAVVCAPSDFAAWGRSLGLDFVPADEMSVEAFLKENVADVGGNPLRVVRAMREMTNQFVPLWFERTLAAGEGADLIVSAAQFVSRSVSEKLGIPLVKVAYSPTMLPSAWYPPLMFVWQDLPRWANRLGWGFVSAVLAAMKPTFNRARARYGLPPIGSMRRYLLDEPHYLLACDPELAPVPPDWDMRRITITGPWFYDDAATLDPEIEAFLAGGTPPVYVGFGSMVNDDVAAVTRMIVEGAAASGRRVLMSKGWAGLGEGSLPAYVKVVHGPMPHAKLFPRMAAVVHHGGSGTTANALRAGVPQVIVPHIMDQFYFAHRLEQLGLAPRAVPIKKLAAASLARSLDAALALDPAPRLAFAERLRAGDGIARAIAILERTTGDRLHVPHAGTRSLSPV